MKKKALADIASLYAKAKESIPDKRCGDCAYRFDTACELYGFVVSGYAPVNVAPPFDIACGLYSETKEINVSALINSVY